MKTIQLSALSEREQAVLKLLVSGMRYKQIAAELNIRLLQVAKALRKIEKKWGTKTSYQSCAVYGSLTKLDF